MTNTFPTTIEVNRNGCDCEVDIIVTYEAVPFSKGGTDGRGGLPIEPDEPAHIEIISAAIKDTGQEIELTTAQENAIEESIAESLNDEYEAAMEHRAECRRELREEGL